MKILFVCQQYIHASRWINQLKDSGHEIFVIDCLDKPIHKDLRWTNYITNWSKRKLPKIKGEYFLEKKRPKLFKKIEPFLKVTPSEKLVEIIKEIKPDLVHSLEMQSQTYHVLKARKKVKFKWAYFSWGSDIYFYQNNKQHKKTLKQVFSKLNYLFVDNRRDIKLAQNLGFIGKVCGVFPGGGGYHLEEYKEFIKPLKERNLILIKGYHHWAGRALIVLKALELIIDKVKEYKIYVYSAHDIVIHKIEELNKKYNINIEYSSRRKQITQVKLLKKFGEAQIAIGNNISDGIPNTLLEALILGAFPIQSNPGQVTEDYIENNINGMLIDDCNNPKEISNHILKALKNEGLQKNAFKINQQKIKMLDYQKIKREVISIYNELSNK